MKDDHTATRRSPASFEAMQARFALRVAAHLSEGAEQLPHDLGERLRHAREQALLRAAAVRRETAPAMAAATGVVVSAPGLAALTLGGDQPDRAPWWLRFAAIVPLIALILGLLAIQDSNTRAQINAAAEVDTALLSDDLPPSAYSDPGFGEYLRSERP